MSIKLMAQTFFPKSQKVAGVDVQRKLPIYPLPGVLYELSQTLNNDVTLKQKEIIGTILKKLKTP